MNLPAEIWQLESPFRRMAWAVLLLARYEVLEEVEGADEAARFLTSEEANDLLDLLGVNREQFLSSACGIVVERRQ